jgi:hypothetical protein
VGGGQHLDLGALLLQGDGIGNDHLIEDRLFEVLNGFAGEDRVGDEGADAPGAVFHDDPGGLAQGSGGVDDIVQEDHIPPLDIADQCHPADLVRLGALFVTDHEVGVKEFGVGSNPAGAPDVGRSEGQVLEVQLLEVGDEDGPGSGRRGGRE